MRLQVTALMCAILFIHGTAVAQTTRRNGGSIRCAGLSISV